MLELKNVTKTYGKDFNAVNRLSFKLERGRIAGFVGENGAGKTTTIKMMTGILKPTSGQIIVNGHNIGREPIEAKRSLAYVADDPDMFLRLTGIEFINLMADIYGVEEELRIARIENIAKRFDIFDALSSSMKDYSHGMRQKIMILAALIHEPPVWILDEPMTGLDPRSAYELKNMMKEHVKVGNCVFFSTHVLEVAEELCDIIYVIRKGSLVFSGSIDELRALYPDKTLEEIFIALNS